MAEIQAGEKAGDKATGEDMGSLCEPFVLALFGLACTLIGVLAGHRLQLGAKLREERNVAAAALRVQFAQLADDTRPERLFHPGDHLHVLMRTAGSFERRRLRRLMAEYRKATELQHGQAQYGAVHTFADTQRVVRAASALARFCRHR